MTLTTRWHTGNRMPFFMSIPLYAAKYIPAGFRPLNLDEHRDRETARALKIPTQEAIDEAAPRMAALIDGPCWLVPVPASNGSLHANGILAHVIASLVPGARTKNALGRMHPVESSCVRRRKGEAALPVEAHAIIRACGPFDPLPVFFIDNVITSGNTIAACRRALGCGTGLCFADASTAHNTRALPEPDQAPDLEPQLCLF